MRSKSFNLGGPMITSARSLNQILTLAAASNDKKAKFLGIAAELCRQEGPEAHPKTIVILSRLIRQIDLDIEKLPRDEDAKNDLRSYASKFNGLRSFSQFHLTIGDAKQHFLSPENLNGLTILDHALSGFIEHPVLTAEHKALAASFDALRLDIRNAELPERIRALLDKRIAQISAILTSFQYYGDEALEEEIEALAGALAIHQNAIKKSDNSLYGKLVKATFGLIGVLAVIDASLEHLNSISENTGQLIEFIDGSTEN